MNSNKAEPTVTETDGDVQPIELSVVIPCLDEADTVAICVSKARETIEALGVAGEIIVADNGSTDGSQQLAIEAGARIVDVPVRGYGSALMHGIAAARGLGGVWRHRMCNVTPMT